MIALVLAALPGFALSLSILMAVICTVQQRVDAIWTLAMGLVGADSALWPIAGAAPNARQ